MAGNIATTLASGENTQPRTSGRRLDLLMNAARGMRARRLSLPLLWRAGLKAPASVSTTTFYKAHQKWQTYPTHLPNDFVFAVISAAVEGFDRRDGALIIALSTALSGIFICACAPTCL